MTRSTFKCLEQSPQIEDNDDSLIKLSHCKSTNCNGMSAYWASQPGEIPHAICQLIKLSHLKF